MHRLERVAENLARWSRAFAEATEDRVTAFANSVRNLARAIAEAVSRMYTTLEGAVVDVAVEFVVILVSLRQAVLILVVPALLTWCAIHWSWKWLWVLPVFSWLVILVGLADTPSRFRSAHGGALTPHARAFLKKGGRLLLRAFFVSVTAYSVWHAVLPWFPGSGDRELRPAIQPAVAPPPRQPTDSGQIAFRTGGDTSAGNGGDSTAGPGSPDATRGRSELSSNAEGATGQSTARSNSGPVANPTVAAVDAPFDRRLPEWDNSMSAGRYQGSAFVVRNKRSVGELVYASDFLTSQFSATMIAAVTEGSPTGAWWGIAFGITSTDSFYLFWINDGGSLELLRRTSAGWMVLANEASSRIHRGLNVQNELHIEVGENTVRLFINSGLVRTSGLAIGTAGQVALYADGFAKGGPPSAVAVFLLRSHTRTPGSAPAGTSAGAPQQLSSTQAYGPSFDCAHAATEVEQMICRDAELSQLDNDVAKAYRAAQYRTSDFPSLRRSQRAWIAERGRCNSRDCVAAAFRLRISQLTQY